MRVDWKKKIKVTIGQKNKTTAELRVLLEIIMATLRKLNKHN